MDATSMKLHVHLATRKRGACLELSVRAIPTGLKSSGLRGAKHDQYAYCPKGAGGGYPERARKYDGHDGSLQRSRL